MRKLKVALAVFGLSVAGYAGAATVVKTDATQVDVYGYARGAHVFKEQGTKNGTDASEIQAGVKVKQQFNPLFAGIAQYESQYNIHPETFVHRQAWGGVDAGQYGAVTVGRQTGVLYSVTGLTDMAPGVLSGYSAAADTGLLGRADSVIQYKNTVGDTTFIGQYKLSKDGKTLERNKRNEGAAYGGSVVTKNIADSGIFAGAGYANQEAHRQHASSNTYTGAVGWTDGKWYTAASSTVGKNTTDVKSFFDNEVIAQYSFDNGLTPSLGYVDTNAFGSRTKAVETGVTYQFNKNVKAYVDAGWDTAGKDNIVKTAVQYSW